MPRLANAGIRATSWTLSAAWVPPWHSGSPLLTVARHIPAGLTTNLGPLVGAVESALGPLAGVFGWSSGVARNAWSFSSGLVGGGAEPSDSAESSATPSRGQLSPEQQYLLDQRKDDKRPAHKKQYARRFYSSKAVDLGMKVVLREGLDGIGQEALLCLAKGDGANWGWGEGPEDVLGEDLRYERGFAALKRAWGANPGMAPRRLRVFYGSSDFLVPTRGQDFLRRLLVDKLRLVEATDWTMIQDAGHDDIVGLTMFAEPMLDMFAEAAGVRQP